MVLERESKEAVMAETNEIKGARERSNSMLMIEIREKLGGRDEIKKRKRDEGLNIADIFKKRYLIS